MYIQQVMSTYVETSYEQSIKVPIRVIFYQR